MRRPQHDAWTLWEIAVMVRGRERFGNKWSAIARYLPNRVNNDIKNYCNWRDKEEVGGRIALCATSTSESRTLLGDSMMMPACLPAPCACKHTLRPWALTACIRVQAEPALGS